MSPQASRDSRLSFCTKMCYGIGGVPNQVASSATAFYLQLFLLDVAQVRGQQRGARCSRLPWCRSFRPTVPSATQATCC